MNRKYLLIILTLLLITHADASYIKDGNIVLLRSQFKTESITVDGKLSEELWQKAGSLMVGFGTENINLYFVNDENKIYFGAMFKTTDPINVSMVLFFDVDDDGKLNTPEDAKGMTYLDSTLEALDYYWDNNWILDTQSDSDYKIKATVSDGIMSIEMSFDLVSNNLQYDGFQIPDPTGQYIAFTYQIIKDNKTYQFPTSPSNVTNYIDLKLAGPEDQDLPEYIPPQREQTVVDKSGTEQYDAGSLNAELFWPSDISVILLIVGSLIVRRKRK